MNSLLVKGLQFVCNPFLFEYSRNYFLGRIFTLPTVVFHSIVRCVTARSRTRFGTLQRSKNY